MICSVQLASFLRRKAQRLRESKKKEIKIERERERERERELIINSNKIERGRKVVLKVNVIKLHGYFYLKSDKNKLYEQERKRERDTER